MTIAITELAFAYPDGHQALFGINLNVAAGERVAILGPNGSGKTTLALHFNALHLPQHGSVVIDGIPVSRRTANQVRRHVGILFQDPDDQLFLPTVAEDVAFGPRTMKLPDADARVARALEIVGLTDVADRPPHHLSYGQKQRAALAGVLAMGPDIVVLDEPTSALDPASQRELVEVLQTLDATLVVITHDLPLALQLCSRAVILDEGIVVADGLTHTLLADDDLLAAHRLELPWGFDRRLLDADPH